MRNWKRSYLTCPDVSPCLKTLVNWAFCGTSFCRLRLGLEVSSVSSCVVWRGIASSIPPVGYEDTGSIPDLFLESIGKESNRVSHKRPSETCAWLLTARALGICCLQVSACAMSPIRDMPFQGQNLASFDGDNMAPRTQWNGRNRHSWSISEPTTTFFYHF